MMRRLAASTLLLASLALFAVTALPRQRLHALLSARAGHSVTADYVERVAHRTLICGGIALVIALVTFSGAVRLERRRLEPWPAPDRVAAIVIGIGIAVRAMLLNGPPHYDEAFTITEFASQSPLFIVTRYTHPNNHVFHTLLVWVVRAVAGDHLWALRLPAFAAGIAVLFASYALAHRLHGQAVARVSVALVAVATPLIEYSVQARGYTILALAFLLLFLVDDDRARVLILALGAWTIPTMLYAAAAWALWFAWTQRAWRRLAAVTLASGALTFLLYLPILIVTGPTSIFANGTTLTVSYPVLMRELPKKFVVLANEWSLSFTVPVAIALSIAALVAIVRRTPGGIALGITLMTIAGLLLALRKVPFPRVWLFVLPLALIAAASTMVWRRGVPASILILATVLFAANAVRVTDRNTYVEDAALRDAARVAAVIRAMPPDIRVLVSTPLDAAYAFYVHGPQLVQGRFDSDPNAVRAAMLAASRRFAVVSNSAGGDEKLRALALPFQWVPVARFPHSTLLELRSAR